MRILLLALLACNKDDDGFDRSYGGGDDGDDTAVDSGGGDDSGPTHTGDTSPDPVAYDPDGGGEDTFDATWSRCEELGAGGVRWTFHAELRYAASDVQVELDLGDQGYELWYLETADSGAGLVWEVAVENLSNRTCDEWIELLWTASGGTEWSTTYESLYTPP